MTPGFICRHVSAGAPVLRAVRDTPLDDDDSGWCCTCGQDDHETADYLLVNLDRYVMADRSLKAVLDSAINTIAERATCEHPWVIEAIEAI